MTDAALPSAGSIARGGAWRLAASFVPQAYVLAVSLVAARVLGPDGMGRQSFISFIAATVTLLLTGGLAASLMRHVAELVGRGQHLQIAALVHWTARRQAAAAAVAAAALGTYGVLEGGGLLGAWGFAALAVAIGVVHSVPNAVLVGFQRWRQHSVRALAVGGFGAAAAIVALLLGWGIAGMFAAEALAAAIGLLATTALAARLLPGRGRTEPLDVELRARTRTYARGALLQLILHVIVWRRTELLVLERTNSAAAIAHYSIAFSLLTVLTRVPTSITATLSPAFATMTGAGQHERVADGFARAVRLLLLASIPMTAALLATGPRVLTTFYGGEYAPAGTALLIMAPAIPFVALHHIGVSLLQGIGSVRPLVVAGAAATVVDLALAIALIPQHGAVGAATANVCAQVTAGALTVSFARRAVGPVHLDVRALAGVLIASASGAIAAWWAVSAVAGIGGLLVAAAAGTTTLTATAAVLGVVARADAAWLSSSVRGPVGRAVARAAAHLSA